MATLDPKVFADAPEVFTIKEAAALMKVNERTIRDAVRSKELEASIVGGRNPRQAGRGLGYRITRQALQDWFFGTNKPKEA